MARKKNTRTTRTTRTTKTADRTLAELDQRDDYKTVIDENTDDLKRSEEAFSEDQMPDLDFGEIMFVHPIAADNMIEVADKMIDRMMEHVGPDKQKPSIPGLREMYDKTFEIKDRNAGSIRKRKDDNYIPTVKEIEVHAPATLDDLLKAKFTFEKNSHKNKADSMRASINVGAAIATIKVNWDFAVQTYKETRENAEANFKEAVYVAYINEEFQTDTRIPNFFNDILSRLASFTFAVGISKAMDSYGKELAKANASLSTAFSTLSNELVKQWNAMTQSETALILANRTDSLNLWTAIRAAYNKSLSGNRRI